MVTRRLVSALWSSLTALARGLERAGLGARRVGLGSARVISVGNIQAGGTGKTPLVIRIAREAHLRGLAAAVLIRGYRGGWEHSGGVIAPGAPSADPTQAGDEAALVHDQAPDAWIGVGADRVAQFERVCELAGKIDVVILDDGFQNRRITKSVEVVALTSAGRDDVFFRDSFGALARADLLVWTKGEHRPARVPADKPMVRARYALPAPAAGDSSSQYWLVTGLADGAAARASIEEAGYRITRHLRFTDHARYSSSQVREILAQARAQSAPNVRILVTGKDWVKWRHLGVKADEVTVLEPVVEFIEGEAQWERIVWGG